MRKYLTELPLKNCEKLMERKYYDTYNNKKHYLYTIGDGDVRAVVSDFGGLIQSLTVGGTDIALGFNGIADYISSATYCGATVGRVANRIAGGKFSLGEETYSLTQNDGANHLHGGGRGFDKRAFEVLGHTANSLTLRYIAADGEEGYPGKMTFTVTFTVTDGGLGIKYTAASDKDTLFCPTCHTYFNLDGEGSGDCLGNMLTVNASYYTPADEKLIPTGEKAEVENTPFDFRKPKAVGADYGAVQVKAISGYDCNFILDGSFAARAESLKTGVKMTVYTDMPCMQLYTGGMMARCRGKNGFYDKWYGFCLEPQFCPNAVNMDGFEKPLLKKGEKTTYYIEYKFD